MTKKAERGFAGSVVVLAIVAIIFVVVTGFVLIQKQPAKPSLTASHQAGAANLSGRRKPRSYNANV